jgi:hypothetical protein
MSEAWAPGITVRIREGVTDPRGMVVPGAEYRIEDLWIKITGTSWGESQGNPAALQYAMRAAFNDLPLDDDVLYGKIAGIGHLVHVSEIEAAP